jgi:hypothetical protein
MVLYPGYLRDCVVDFDSFIRDGMTLVDAAASITPNHKTGKFRTDEINL